MCHRLIPQVPSPPHPPPDLLRPTDLRQRTALAWRRAVADNKDNWNSTWFSIAPIGCCIAVIWDRARTRLKEAKTRESVRMSHDLVLRQLYICVKQRASQCYSHPKDVVHRENNEAAKRRRTCTLLPEWELALTLTCPQYVSAERGEPLCFLHVAPPGTIGCIHNEKSNSDDFVSVTWNKFIFRHVHWFTDDTQHWGCPRPVTQTPASQFSQMLLPLNHTALHCAGEQHTPVNDFWKSLGGPNVRSPGFQKCLVLLSSLILMTV